MRNKMNNKGFTLVEALVSLSIIVILITVMVGAGKHLKTRAEKELTAGGIAAIVTALGQYYDVHTAFPPQVADKAALETALGGTVSGTNQDAYCSSQLLFYYLDKTPACRKTIEDMPARMITNKDAAGGNLKVTIAGVDYDLVRFVDAWGTSLRYIYQAGDAFPLLESAGPDKDFATTGDNLSSQ